MSRLSKVLRRLEAGRVLFRCPGCKENHQITVFPDPSQQGPLWGYNGNPDAPTFTPSILLQVNKRLTEDEISRVMAGEIIERTPTVCHSFVTDGNIQFLSDCTHELAGQTVPLPEI